MEKIDILIKNGMIMTMDDKNTIIENGFLCITGDHISQVDRFSENKYLAEKVIDARGGIVLPGLINGHTHAAMSLFRGLADDLPLMDWLNHYIFPVESRMDADFVYTGTMLACAEMLMNGTTSFCDMYLFEEEVASAAKNAGMRCLVGEVLYDFPSPNYGTVDNGLLYTESLIRKWQDDPLVSIAVEPHSLFTCDPSLLKKAHTLSRQYDVPLIIHVAETLQELDEIQRKYNKRPVEHLQSLGLLGPHLIADHCVHLDHNEIRMLADHGVKIIHNPESNMKLASGIAPVPEMLHHGLAVGLGTDGCASNNNLDLFTEMDITAKLHKIQHMDPTVMDAVTVLRMATIDGARALGMDHIIGSLEPGKKADVIILDINKPHLTPIYNPYSHLVYSAKGSDVFCSIINGRPVMEDRRLLTIDLDEIMSRSREKASDVLKWISME